MEKYKKQKTFRFNVGDWFRKHKLLRLLIVIFLIWVWGLIGVMSFERAGNGNPKLQTVGSCSWGIFVYLFSGVEDYDPNTIGGRCCSLVVLVGAIGVSAIFIATVTSILVEAAKRTDLIPLKPTWRNFKGHTIIANWNNKGNGIIQELRSEVIEKKSPIIILSKKADTIEKENGISYPDVWTVKGDPTHDSALRKANVEHADTAIILADQTPYSDAKSILVTHAIESIHHKIHTCVELCEPKNRDLLEESHVDEIISTSELTEKLIAQTSLSHGLTKVYWHLLKATVDTNEIYKIEVDGNLKKLLKDKTTFGQLQLILLNHQVILIGIKRVSKKINKYGKQVCDRTHGWPVFESVLIINPQKRLNTAKKSVTKDKLSTDDFLKEKDELFMIAYKKPDIIKILEDNRSTEK